MKRAHAIAFGLTISAFGFAAPSRAETLNLDCHSIGQPQSQETFSVDTSVSTVTPQLGAVWPTGSIAAKITTTTILFELRSPTAKLQASIDRATGAMEQSVSGVEGAADTSYQCKKVQGF